MKIALVSDLFPPYVLGGAERRYYNLALQLSKRHEVHVYTMLMEGAKKKEKTGRLTVHRLGIPHPLRERSFFPMLAYLAALIRALSKEKYDVIDCNAYFSALGGYLASRGSGTPVVVTIHDIYAQNWGKFMGSRLLGPVGWSIEILLTKLRFDRIVTVSRSSERLLEKIYCVKKERICVIPNGADSEFHANPRTKRDMNKILCVGRLVPLKNVQDLIIAFSIALKKNPELALELVGEGPLRQELAGLCKKLGVEEKVTFTGTIGAHGKVAEKMRSCGMLATASLREGFGLTLIEAMACGTPVVAYRLSAYDEFAGAYTPFLVERRDVQKLADAILEVSENKNLRQKMSREGIKTARDFTWEKAAEKTEELYWELK